MSLAFGAQCDDFHLANRLFLKMDLAMERETILHFFDSIKREFRKCANSVGAKTAH